METDENVIKVVFDKILNENGEQDGLTHNEIWDDTMLIQHYDEAMDKARRLLATKLSSASSLTDSECSNSHRTEIVNGYSHSKLHLAASLKKKKKKKNRKKNEWHAGDPCRANYSEDGQSYEATIIGINNASGTCTVRYLGYNNHEDVAQSSLLKSNGEGSRRRQLKEVALAGIQTDETSDDSCDVVSEAPSDNDRRDQTKFRPGFTNMAPPQQNFSGIPPSFPSMPTQSNHSIPHIPDLPPPPALGLVDGSDPLTSEALHTMLMSWYMTGYHTGYYQGLTHGKNLLKSSSSHHKKSSAASSSCNNNRNH